MKQIKHLFTALLLFSVAVNAYGFEVGGIYYNITDESNKTVALTNWGNENIGSVVIPKSVEYNGNAYSVTSIGNEAFRGCSGLTSVVIPNSVTSIGSYTFYDCSGLTSIEIPNSVTSIGSCAFSYCSGLTSVVIPNSVTSIGRSAFSGCSGLTSIEIPNSVTSIGSSAFYNCSGFTSIVVAEGNANYDSRENCNAIIEKETNTLVVGCKNTIIPNSVTSIGDYAFNGRSGLASIEIPNSVTSIGDEAFAYCSGLTSIEIPNSVTSIGEGAFKYCHRLTSIEIPNSVTSIGDEAFWNCDGLTSIEIPNSVTSIGERAFYECSGLTSIEIPNSVTSIGRSAFAYCSGLTSIVIGNSVTSIGLDAFYKCSGLTSIVIPNSVTSIGNSAFSGCSGLTSIVIPNSITSIGSSVFRSCSGLTSVVIPNSVTSIEGSAFYGCTGLTSILIPNSVTSIGGSAFYGCTGLTSIEIPNSVTSIGSQAFSGCSGLTSIEFNAENCTTMGDSYYPVFGGCTALATVRIGENVKTIPDYAFRNCSGLTSIEIPNSVTSIGSSAFYNCSGLTSIVVAEGNANYDSRENCNAIIEKETNTLVVGCKNTIIPNSVTSIGERAFYECSGLTSIEIPNSVTGIGKNAFYGCSGLTSVEFNAENCTTMGNSSSPVFNGCTALATVRFGENVKTIPAYAFRDCSGLTSVTIGNSVTSIGSRAFYSCSGLTSVVIGNSVTSIGNWAFEGCSNLKTVINLSSLTITKGESSNGYVGYYAENVIKVINAPNATIEGDFVFSVIDGVNTLVLYLGNDTEIVLPDNYSKGNYAIGEAFRDNTSITSIEIPNSVTSIGDEAFWNCDGLTSIEIPNSVTSIGDYAFNGCTSLNDLRIEDGEGILSLGYHTYNSSGKGMFYDCPLETLYLGRNLSYKTGYEYGYSPFYNKKSLTSVTIPNSVTSIGDRVFYGCSGLTSIEIPNSVTSIAASAFRGCSGLTSVEIPNSVTSIGSNAFDGCSGLTSVEIPNSVTSIGSYTFYNCSGLTSVVIGNSVTSIGDYAFYNCSGLTNIEIPNSVTSIGERTFSYCSGLTSIEIPNSVTSIGSSAFSYCSGLTSVEIPNSVTSIGDGLFSCCSGLTSIVVAEGNAKYDSRENCNAIIEKETNTLVVGCKNTIIPNSVTSIGSSAFYDCSGLTSVVIGNSVKSIGDNAFGYCSGLTSVVIPNSVKSIGRNAFFGCSGLTSVEIPNSITSIGDYAFLNCKNLKTVINYSSLNIEKGLTSYGYIAYYADNVVIPITVTGISLNKSTATITEGGTTTLTATIAPSDATDKTVTWASDNEEVATVENGVVTAVKAGTATITATAGDYSASCVVTVDKKVIAVTGISLDKSTATIAEGETETLVATITPADATDKTVTWTSSDASIATVADGVVTAVKAGTATITATAGGYSATCVVTVEEPKAPITSLAELSNTAVYYICQPNHSKGKTSWAVATGGENLKSNKDLDIATDMNDTRQQFAILSVDGGVTRYLYHIATQKFVNLDGSLSATPFDAINFIAGAYTNTFIAYFDDSHYVNVGGSRQMIIDKWNTPDGGNSCSIIPVGEFDSTNALKVLNESTTDFEITGITLDKSTATITEGETTTLVATIEPSNATDKTVTWATSDASIATVEGGVVTAVKAGTATITATAGDYSASCVVTVEKKVIAVTGITLDKETATIIEGETTTLVATIAPADATDKTVTWATSDASIATVEGGVVTAVKAGTATITATAGDCSASCVVTVKAVLKAGINYRIKHNTTGYYMTVVSTESSDQNEGGVQIKALDNAELNQIFILESVAENSYKIKSINGYYLSSFATWGYNATVNNSDAAKHQFTEVEESVYTLFGNLGYIGSNNDDKNGNVDGAWIYSNHGSGAQNIYWVFEPLTAEENKALVALRTAEAMSVLERSIARGKEVVSSREAALSEEDKASINTAVSTAENEKGNACGDVDEEIARLNALAKAIDKAVENAIYVWSIDDISNSVCYTVSTEDRGSWYSQEAHLNSTQKLGIAHDIADANQQFAFVKSPVDGKLYLYSVGQEKFVTIDNSYTSFSGTPLQSVGILEGTRSEAYPWVVAFDTAAGEKQISVSNGYDPGVITSWNDLSDSGNTVRLEIAAAFDATEALELLEGYTLTVSDATYGWATLVLGFNAAIPTDAGFEAYTIASVDGSGIELEAATGVLGANTPVIINAPAGEYRFEYTSEAATVTPATDILKGTLVNKAITEKVYILSAVEGVVGFYVAKQTDGVFTAKAHKAYMVLPSENAVSFYGFRDEETTAVEALTEQGTENLIYDLSGRRVLVPEKGVYIVNGKKQVVK